jgi:hypothetical protein
MRQLSKKIKIQTYNLSFLELTIVMGHQSSDVVHASLSSKYFVFFRNFNWKAMTIEESLWNLPCTIAVAAFKAIVSSPRLRFQSFRDIQKNNFRVHQKKVVLKVVRRFKSDRNIQSSQASRYQSCARQGLIVGA